MFEQRTDRNKYTNRSVPQDFFDEVKKLSSDNFHITFVTDKDTKDRIADIVSNAQVEAIEDAELLKNFTPTFVIISSGDDEMSYITGLSKMKFNQFFLANIFGHIGGSLGLAYVGSGISYKDTLFWVLAITSLIAFLLLWRLMKRPPATTEFE